MIEHIHARTHTHTHTYIIQNFGGLLGFFQKCTFIQEGRIIKLIISDSKNLYNVTFLSHFCF